MLELCGKLVEETSSKIVLAVMDGLGGLPREDGKTELEAARTPQLDDLARRSECGLLDAVGPGISPGSGPGHLALFGYDPVRYEVGRGVLSALGLGFELGKNDLAVRVNFCTVDSDGKVVDRRAGRIATERNKELCEKLRSIRIPGVEIFILTEAEHRACVIFRGAGLEEGVADTDPQAEGKFPLAPVALRPEAKRASEVTAEFLRQAARILKDEHPANMLLMRGFAKFPTWPSLADLFKLKAAAIATYPAYRGMARLVGMTILDPGKTLADEVAVLEANLASYTYLFLHFKYTDKYGEDGNFDAKVHAIEEFDALLPKVLNCKPDVIAITGDHSTPWLMKKHSWHPSPVLIHSKYARWGFSRAFSERECATGSLGRLAAVHLMPLLLAHAGKLEKFGA